MLYRGRESGELIKEDSRSVRRTMIHTEISLEEVPPAYRDPYLRHTYERIELLDERTGAVVKKLKVHRFEAGIDTHSELQANNFLSNVAALESEMVRERFGPETSYLFDRMIGSVPTDRRLPSRARPELEDTK